MTNNEKELNKSKEVNKLFNYVISKANKLGLNLLISIDGVNKMVLAGDPDEMYAKMFNKLNKRAIIEFERKRKNNMTFYDLFNRIMEIYKMKPNIIDVIYGNEKHYGSGMYFEVDGERNISFQLIPFVKVDNPCKDISIKYDGGSNINFSKEKDFKGTHNFLTIMIDNGSSKYLHRTFDFHIIEDNGKLLYYLGNCERSIFGITMPSPEKYKLIGPDNPTTFVELLKDEFSKIDIDALAALMDYKLPDEVEDESW